ncbi:MAG: LLM class flavin-dependent oxidoreductase [Candidatus Tectomicrobia bacterium]|uniref:LLM class flavin-dependent oxidoreductase n=1 Tax=Tectimicrobiota bacterium TaxID=2528274 RepID=A0A937W330_UNCTE|nr:LLM class flavin-dependent oxidoreductase [Candidatus Tectomicrobia bacterium]
MEFGCFFVGQRPLVHEQYVDGQPNPLPIARTDAQVYHDILRGARLAETLGFDSVWIAEHAFSEHSIISAPHTLLGAIAAQTTRVKVGVACSIVPWYHPLRLAQDLATLDIISEGRLVIGIGRGYQKQEFDAYGMDIAESRQRFVEGMDITLKAWSQDQITYEGQFYTIPEVRVIPKPLQQPHPPIAMAVTHSPASVDFAVQHRWGIVTVGSTFFPAAPEADENLITLYRTKMLASGVASDDLTIIAARNTYVAARDGEAHAFMQPRFQWAGDLAQYLRSPVSALARAGSLQGYENYARDPFIDPELVQRRGQEAMGAIGTPAQVTATIKDLQAKHVTHFLCYMDLGGLSYEEMAPAMRLFAEQVMPHFK